MQLSLSAKEHFFHSLAQMLQSGVTAPQAFLLLAQSRGRGASAAAAVSTNIELGVAEAMEAAGFAPLDASIVGAGEQSGKLDEACVRLSEYYASMAAARRQIFGALIYPVVIFHLGVILLAIPPAVVAGGITAFASEVALWLGSAYLAGALFVGGVLCALRWAQRDVFGDQVLSSVPGLGGFFRTRALSRFCLVLSLGLRSADGVLAGLRRAGRASGSARIARACEVAVGAIREGAGFAEALRKDHVFPADLENAFQVGEASGRLDAEMLRWEGILRTRFLARLNAFAAWLPRMIYVLILFVVAARIVGMTSHMSSTMNEILEME